MFHLIVGAYAALPAWNTWDRKTEKSFLDSFGELSKLDGFEIPFYANVSEDERCSSLLLLKAHLKNVLTCIPGIMDKMAEDPHFGLASTDEEARARALHFMKAARDLVANLNTTFAKDCIRAVFIHSAPRRSASKKESSREAFLKSLQTLRQWDWSGASLIVEHCDRYNPKFPPIKGFLDIEEEIWAVEQVPGIGMCVNWARSVVEERSLENIEKHIRLLSEKSLLKALMFSGTTLNDPHFGNWLDKHAPFSSTNKEFSLASSLLTEERMKKAIEAADLSKLEFIGVKVAPSHLLKAEDRFACVRSCFESLVECVHGK